MLCKYYIMDIVAKCCRSRLMCVSQQDKEMSPARAGLMIVIAKSCAELLANALHVEEAVAGLDKQLAIAPYLVGRVLGRGLVHEYASDR